MKQGCPQAIVRCFRSVVSICPWSLAKQSQHKAASLSHLEEEEFQFSSLSRHASEQDDRSNRGNTSTMHQPNVYAEQQNVEVKLNLPQHESEESSLNVYSRNGSDVEPISSFDFRLNLEPSHQHFELLESRTQNIRGYFQQQSSVVVTRGEKSKITIREVESVGSFKMILSYWLPCSYEYYSSLSRQLSAELANVIQKHQATEVLQPNLTMNQLLFKKFMLLEPRWFNYIKYVNSSGSSHWEVCLSVKGRPISDNTLKECEMFAITCFNEKTHGLNVNSYVQVDLKSNIRARKVVQRVCEQMANYFDNLWSYTSNNYSQVLA